MLKRVAVLCLVATLDDSSTSSENSSKASGSEESSSDSLMEERSVLEEDNEYDRVHVPLRICLTSKHRIQRIQNYLEIVKSWNYDGFRKNLRVSRRTAYDLIRNYQQSQFFPRNIFGKIPVSADISIIIFLWFIGNTEPLRTLSERFDVSISSIFRIMRRVADFLIYKSSDMIKWPQNAQVINTTNKFLLIAGMPNVLGAIDCTHVKIAPPKVHGRDFYNRKKYHPINLQIVVDSKMRFTNVYCGEPGSLHYARVLRRSSLYNAANNNPNLLFLNNTFLIGDSAYPLYPWLINPFRNDGRLTQNQIQFNQLISSTIVVVKRAFGCLKGRFRRIKFFTEYTDLELIVRVVMAACVLHNYCIDENDNPVDIDKDDDSDIEYAMDEDVDSVNCREQIFVLRPDVLYVS